MWGLGLGRELGHQINCIRGEAPFEEHAARFADLATPESSNGSPKVISPPRQLFSKGKSVARHILNDFTLSNTLAWYVGRRMPPPVNTRLGVWG